MYRVFFCTSLMAWPIVFWQPGSASAADPAALAKQFSPRAEVVLRGTIEFLRTSTVPVEDATALAVVRVAEVVSGPSLARQFVGRDVTIRLNDPGQAKEGEERIFFATTWYVGEGLGLAEVGSSKVDAVGANTSGLAMEMDKARVAEADAALAERMRDAKTIVSGRVVAIRAPQRRMLSEHDPEWTEADIEVTETLKGTASGKVTILFPASQDVMWYQVPKPKLAQTGIWILRSGLTGAATPEQIGVSGAADFLPPAELPRIKKLLAR